MANCLIFSNKNILLQFISKKNVYIFLKVSPNFNSDPGSLAYKGVTDSPFFDPVLTVFYRLWSGKLFLTF